MNNGPVTHFTTRPSGNTHPSYRIVILFEPLKTLVYRHPRGDAAELEFETRDGRLWVSIAFCVNDSLYAHVDSRTPRAESPHDPAFRKMMARATFLLIPSVDSHHRR